MKKNYSFITPRNDRFVLEERKSAKERARENCDHSAYLKLCSDCNRENCVLHSHWRKVCQNENCRKQFESEAATSEIWGNEILL